MPIKRVEITRASALKHLGSREDAIAFVEWIEAQFPSAERLLRYGSHIVDGPEGQVEVLYFLCKPLEDRTASTVLIV